MTPTHHPSNAPRPVVRLLVLGLLCVALGLLCVVLGYPAIAQGPDEPADASPASPTATTPESQTAVIPESQTAVSPASSVSATRALEEGNRLFRNGQLEAALEAYRSGYAPDSPHPTLLYNLATTLHHLDRLPEAILWYRRAAESQDPWLEENLWLARRSLGSQTLPPAGLLGTLVGHTDLFRLTAIALAWLTFGALLFGRPSESGRTPWPLLVGAGFACLLYACALAIGHWGPRPAVLMTDCSTAVGDLPAGTEVWVTPSPGDAWQISGSSGAICPSESLELVIPKS